MGNSFVRRSMPWFVETIHELSKCFYYYHISELPLYNYFVSELCFSFPFIERANIKLILRPAKRKILIRCKRIIIFSDHKKHKHDMGTKNYLFPSLTSSCFTRKFVVMKNLIMHQEEENDQITLLH